MSRSVLTLGPFVGGLNNATNTPDTIDDNELFRCDDFDYTVDNTLVTRPAVALEPESVLIPNVFINILGFFVDPGNGDVYCIASVGNDLYYRLHSTTYVDATDWVLIHAGFGNATAGIQYVDNFYFSKDSSGGAKWNPGGGYSALASIPAGTSLALFKERLWLSSGTTSRLYFSNIADGDTWSVSDFIDINAGDGQDLTAVFAGPSALYLFKTSSTFVLTFDSSPNRGFVQNISTTVGLFDTNSITDYEGSLFILYGSNVYRLDGYTFTRINSKVNITRDATNGTYPHSPNVSSIGDRIMVSYKDNLFVYYPLTNTWTQWILPAVSRWWSIPNSLQKYGFEIHLVAWNSTAPVDGNIFSLQDTDWVTGMPEDYVLADPTILTKMYTMGGPQAFKKLHWWGADAIVAEDNKIAYLQLNAIPYIFDSVPTWYSFAQYTWGQAGATTWGIISEDTSFTTTSLIRVESYDRKYIKALRATRFSRIQFQLKYRDYRHTRKSSIFHLVLDISDRESPVAKTEGTAVV